ncbi:hypothetical protein A1QO_19335 [Vibrio genomosp. F10 str. ZF-129]|uniref:Aminotransferase class I/classII domain-containing protein n=1 Tax=Vibrio genomosp. F10 str. ZF-129 TaxID=1187848 RepID=A0A1E5BHZ7_9VIBR|nr:hypothetical protein [Vibrio genomosp. F10]OEE35972.1 hypothetical protein A1QO_19335 [Vibrio genomosp. F10 str. ZF-129]OEE94270.1 hypothetical protein A1QM_07175 [Vibrio genomosp. F10 str. 9ZC157]
MVNFGFAYPDPMLYPQDKVNKSLVQATRTMPTSHALDNLPPGNETLRNIIAERYAAQGMNISPEEIVNRVLQQDNISIAPGEMFSPDQQFTHGFRLNASQDMTESVKGAIKRLGEQIANMLSC